MTPARNVNDEGKNYSEIRGIMFTGKQNIPWDKVEDYQDSVMIAGDFPDEYTESVYTKKLRGALAKVKANAAQIIDELV